MFIDNKYKSWYYNIIDSARVRGHDKSDLKFYSESHHIIPKSLGGCNDSNNIVLLTSKEHYICHHLLVYMVKSVGHKRKMWSAFFLMHSSPAYEPRYMTARGYCLSKRMMAKAKAGMTPWNKGVPATCDHKDKLSKSWNRDALRNVDKNIYRFERDCGDVFVGTRFDFCKYSNISHKYVYKIVSKNQHKTKGWRVVWESVVIL